ncbi:MAG: pentapeptide repeat-containing protein, partial [Merismopedia sp. SIO2A8]|nr:pentapeptide repeat-containing protein [Merismopedia sp. SIO2A8]
ADLRYATLDSAQFRRANLKNANLEGAYAFRTNFEGADVEGADFTNVLLDNEMYELLCEIASGVNPETGRATRDTLDCY